MDFTELNKSSVHRLSDIPLEIVLVQLISVYLFMLFHYFSFYIEIGIIHKKAVYVV